MTTDPKQTAEPQIPWQNTPEGLREAIRTEHSYALVFIDGKACDTCVSFSSVGMAYPGGWCRMYPSQQVNTACDKLCPKWERRTNDAQS